MESVNATNSLAANVGVPTTNASSLPCIGFGGSGFLIFYYIGVTSVLRSLGLLSDSTKLAGASGGSIHSASICGAVNQTDQFYAYRDLARTCRPATGCRGFLDAALTKSLYAYLPSDIAERCSGRMFVAVTQAQPEGLPDTSLLLGPNWTNRTELLWSVRASSYIPVQSGASATFGLGFLQPPVQAYDGGFSVQVSQPPDMGSCVKVASAPRPENTTSSASATAAASARFAVQLAQINRGLVNSSDPASAPYLPLNPLPPPQVLPDIYPGYSGPLLVPTQQWNAYGLAPPDDATLLYQVDVGRRDAAFWAVENRLATPAQAIQALADTTITG